MRIDARASASGLSGARDSSRRRPPSMAGSANDCSTVRPPAGA